MYTYKIIFSFKEVYIMTKAFSLIVTCLETNENVEFQNSSFICANRQTILNMASQLGFIIKDETSIATTDYQDYTDLLFFITSLEKSVFPVTVNGVELAIFHKVSLIETHWELIAEKAEKLTGNPTLSGGFEFKSLIPAIYFTDFIQSIILLDSYKKK